MSISSMLRDGIEARRFSATLYVYLLGLGVFLPIAVALHYLVGEPSAIVVSSTLAAAMVFLMRGICYLTRKIGSEGIEHSDLKVPRMMKKAAWHKGNDTDILPRETAISPPPKNSFAWFNWVAIASCLLLAGAVLWGLLRPTITPPELEVMQKRIEDLEKQLAAEKERNTTAHTQMVNSLDEAKRNYEKQAEANLELRRQVDALSVVVDSKATKEQVTQVMAGIDRTEKNIKELTKNIVALTEATNSFDSRLKEEVKGLKTSLMAESDLRDKQFAALKKLIEEKPDPEAKKLDIKNLIGRWKSVKFPSSKTHDIIIDFMEKNHFEIVVDGEIRVKGEYKVDVTPTPHHITLLPDDTIKTPKLGIYDLNAKENLGIYKFTDDKLQIVLHTMGKRPVDFDGGVNLTRIQLTLEREKKDK